MGVSTWTSCPEFMEKPVYQDTKLYDSLIGLCNKVQEEKEKKKENNMFNFDKMMGTIKDGMFRISMNGDIAVRTKKGYKTFNSKTKKLVNCSDFIFDVGDEWFFIVPTKKVKEGDIILVNDEPKCVISTGELISVLNFESSTVEQIVPERHLFMGNIYFYSKVVSMFGNTKKDGKSKNPIKKIAKWKMMSQMFKGDNNNNSDISKLMMYNMLMSGEDSFSEMFEGLFDFDDDEGDEEVEMEIE